ncbi:MAG: hypothetical protein IJI88_03420, partial [Atopobiaceae bacterium]|nr:hypothetical protein [Atopobiaceae bacterium]
LVTEGESASVTSTEQTVSAENKHAVAGLKDVYEEVKSLQITKSVDGLNVTESEFEGALTFTVTNADGKWLDKDGKVCDTEQVLTLKDFAKGDDGLYTLTFNDVADGKYTVTETNSDVEGYKLVTEGESASVTSTEQTVSAENKHAVAVEHHFINPPKRHAN